MKYERNGMIATDWQCCASVLTNGQLMDLDFTINDDAIFWCIQYEGKGRFYLDKNFGQLYFECDEDRTMFLLRWS